MLQSHRKHRVTENDTINGVAKKYGLDTKELIDYHNKRAESYDQIRKRIPDFLREIILPPEGYIIKNGKEVWAKSNQPEPNNLKKELFTGELLSKLPQRDLYYGVLKTIKSGDKVQTIKYNTSMRFYPEDEDGEYFVSVDLVSKVFINDEEVSLVADELAVTCTEVLYPIIFRIDKNSRLLEIQNHIEIMHRWDKQKVTKLRYYEGDTAKNYINLFEETLKDKDLCFHYLKNDWLFYLYFNKIYGYYLPVNKQLSEIVSFPIIPNTLPIDFEVKRSATLFTKNNRLRIDVKGIYSDKRSKSDIEQKLYFPSSSKISNVKGRYRELYFLNPENHRIQSAFLECDLELNKSKYVSISISEIDNIPDSLEIRHPERIKKQYENKKSFWKSLFS